MEGWITNLQENQVLRITRSNSFNSTDQVETIEDASVVIQSRSGQTFLYSHIGNGVYSSNEPFSATSGSEYRARILLSDENEIRSEWDKTPDLVSLNRLIVDSFEENDPDNPGQQFLVYFPRVVAVDPGDKENYYRWRFFKNGEAHIEPESITIQDDRFFDGNVIPNDFRSFGYEVEDEMVVQFQSINKEAYDFLDLLKAQITSLGTSSGTTPAQVNGNLSFVDTEINENVLGYFWTIAISSDTIVVEDVGVQ